VAPVVEKIFAAVSGFKKFRPDVSSAAIRLDLMNLPHDHVAPNQRKNMKNHIHLFISALSITMVALLAPTSFAQQGGAMQKAQAVAQELNLTPQQKEKILPILVAEVPKVNAIKNDNSLSRMQKMEQVRAIHQQTDPQMKSILSPEQYQKLKAIRLQAVKSAAQGRF